MKDDIENLFQKGKTENSPTSLDNLILSQAKNSCEDKPGIRTQLSKKRWLYSLSTAAVVVMSFSIILKLQNENEFATQPIEYIQESKKKISKPTNLDLKKEVNFPMVSSDSSLNSDIPEETAAQSSFLNQDNENRGFVKESTENPVYPVPRFKKDANKTLSKETLQTLEKYKINPAELDLVEDTSELINVMPTGSEMNFENESLAEKPILDSPNLENKNLGNYDSMQLDDSEEVEKITTGSRMMSDEIHNAEEPINSAKEIIKEPSFGEQLEKLDNLIKDKNYKEAKQMLIQLQKNYPYYDFSKYKELLKQ